PVIGAEVRVTALVVDRAVVGGVGAHGELEDRLAAPVRGEPAVDGRHGVAGLDRSQRKREAIDLGGEEGERHGRDEDGGPRTPASSREGRHPMAGEHARGQRDQDAEARRGAGGRAWRGSGGGGGNGKRSGSAARRASDTAATRTAGHGLRRALARAATPWPASTLAASATRMPKRAGARRAESPGSEASKRNGSGTWRSRPSWSVGPSENT